MKLYLSILMFACIFSVQLLAENTNTAVKIKVPEELDVLYINGEKQRQFLFGKKSEIEARTGLNRVVLRYKAFWGDDDDFDKVVSPAFMLQFTVKQGVDYRLELPVINDVEQAKTYAKSATALLYAQHNRAIIDVKISYHLDEKSMLQQMTVVEGSNETDGVKDLVKYSDNDALKQLGFWWQQASDVQRQQFLQSVL
ncbi:MAG: DUF2057 family protein [Pseudomonadales bacterium]|nr:DUF2057 family protein [Pseudomonadales bacterium]